MRTFLYKCQHFNPKCRIDLDYVSRNDADSAIVEQAETGAVVSGHGAIRAAL